MDQCLHIMISCWCWARQGAARVVYIAQSHDVQSSRVAAGGKQRTTCRLRRTESRVLWKSAMLTFVVPESGSAAAALRAIVDAGSKFNDACLRAGMLGIGWWCEVEGAWTRAQKIDDFGGCAAY
jgi:hypothetical protein